MATAKKGLTGNLVQGHTAPERLSRAEKLLSAAEVARLLNIPLSTFYGWRYKGIGPKAYRLGRNLRYRWADVLGWLDGHADS